MFDINGFKPNELLDRDEDLRFIVAPELQDLFIAINQIATTDLQDEKSAVLAELNKVSEFPDYKNILLNDIKNVDLDLNPAAAYSSGSNVISASFVIETSDASKLAYIGPNGRKIDYPKNLVFYHELLHALSPLNTDEIDDPEEIADAIQVIIDAQGIGELLSEGGPGGLGLFAGPTQEGANKAHKLLDVPLRLWYEGTGFDGDLQDVPSEVEFIPPHPDFQGGPDKSSYTGGQQIDGVVRLVSGNNNFESDKINKYTNFTDLLIGRDTSRPNPGIPKPNPNPDENDPIPFSASDQRDYLSGGPGDDFLYGFAGDDILVGGPGSDFLSGGSEPSEGATVDFDTAVFIGSRSDYNVLVKPNGVTEVTYIGQPNPDGLMPGDTDTLVGIEFLKFTDWGANPVTTEQFPAGGQDIVLLIDVSGSMFNNFDSVKQTAKDLAKAFAEKNSGNQIAIVAFNKIVRKDDLDFSVIRQMGAYDQAAFDEAVETLTIGDGIDEPLYSTVFGLLNNFTTNNKNPDLKDVQDAVGFRADQDNRQIIVFSDEPSREAESGFYSQAEEDGLLQGIVNGKRAVSEVPQSSEFPQSSSGQSGSLFGYFDEPFFYDPGTTDFTVSAVYFEEGRTENGVSGETKLQELADLTGGVFVNADKPTADGGALPTVDEIVKQIVDAATYSITSDTRAVFENDLGEVTQINFSVSRTVGTDFETVQLIYDGDAELGIDISVPKTSIDFAPGELVKTFSVDVLGDFDIEADETFSLSVSLDSSKPALIGAQQADVTILNDDTRLLKNGSEADDILIGTPEDDLLRGLGGDDVITGQEMNDLLEGGSGNDNLLGGSGDDTLLGGDGDDTIIASPGFDVASGGKGADLFALERGDGYLTIEDFSSNDNLFLGEGITYSDLDFDAGAVSVEGDTLAVLLNSTLSSLPRSQTTKQLDQEYSSESLALEFYFVNPKTDRVLTKIENGDVFGEEVFGKNLTIMGTTPDDSGPNYEIGSVLLNFQEGGHIQIENVDPYALFGNVEGDFFGGMKLEEGSYQTSFELYESANAQGALLDILNLSFSVTGDEKNEQPNQIFEIEDEFEFTDFDFENLNELEPEEEEIAGLLSNEDALALSLSVPSETVTDITADLVAAMIPDEFLFI